MDSHFLTTVVDKVVEEVENDLRQIASHPSKQVFAQIMHEFEQDEIHSFCDPDVSEILNGLEDEFQDDQDLNNLTGSCLYEDPNKENCNSTCETRGNANPQSLFSLKANKLFQIDNQNKAMQDHINNIANVKSDIKDNVSNKCVNNLNAVHLSNAREVSTVVNEILENSIFEVENRDKDLVSTSKPQDVQLGIEIHNVSNHAMDYLYSNASTVNLPKDDNIFKNPVVCLEKISENCLSSKLSENCVTEILDTTNNSESLLQACYSVQEEPFVNLPKDDKIFQNAVVCLEKISENCLSSNLAENCVTKILDTTNNSESLLNACYSVKEEPFEDEQINNDTLVLQGQVENSGLSSEICIGVNHALLPEEKDSNLHQIIEFPWGNSGINSNLEDKFHIVNKDTNLGQVQENLQLHETACKILKDNNNAMVSNTGVEDEGNDPIDKGIVHVEDVRNATAMVEFSLGNSGINSNMEDKFHILNKDTNSGQIQENLKLPENPCKILKENNKNAIVSNSGVEDEGNDPIDKDIVSVEDLSNAAAMGILQTVPKIEFSWGDSRMNSNVEDKLHIANKNTNLSQVQESLKLRENASKILKENNKNAMVSNTGIEVKGNDPIDKGIVPVKNVRNATGMGTLPPVPKKLVRKNLELPVGEKTNLTSQKGKSSTIVRQPSAIEQKVGSAVNPQQFPSLGKRQRFNNQQEDFPATKRQRFERPLGPHKFNRKPFREHSSTVNQRSKFFMPDPSTFNRPLRPLMELPSTCRQIEPSSTYKRKATPLLECSVKKFKYQSDGCELADNRDPQWSLLKFPDPFNSFKAVENKWFPTRLRLHQNFGTTKSCNLNLGNLFDNHFKCTFVYEDILQRNVRNLSALATDLDQNAHIWPPKNVNFIQNKIAALRNKRQTLCQAIDETLKFHSPLAKDVFTISTYRKNEAVEINRIIDNYDNIYGS